MKLTYERLRRYEGSWHMEDAELFPEYVLMESDDEGKLKESFSCSGMELYSVSKEAEMFLRELCGADGRLSMSRGVIREGVTCVTEGPLRGLEKSICKIDRHKRLATLKLPALKDLDTIRVGLEITEKTNLQSGRFL